jgi:hypothetical protein
LNVLFSGDVHAKRIYSLANATLGVISTASQDRMIRILVAGAIALLLTNSSMAQS